MQKFYRIFILLMFGAFFNAQAQNKQNPWLIGIGTHGPQMTIGDQFFFKEYFNAKNWNVTPAAGHLKVFRHITHGLSVGTSLSLGSASRKYQSELSREFFLDWDVDLKYSFANGYILKEKCWFDPYIIIGGGLSKWGSLRGDVEGGLGTNIWFTKNVGAFIQASYNFIPHKHSGQIDDDPRPSYMHHSFGLVTRFGKGADRDKDGIPDELDKCPDVPGKEALKGCPDTDGDGIADDDDKCPSVAGLLQFLGCPDTDGDGITDAEDACPNEKGTAEMRGCPDTDGDGIADKEDACPTVKGLASLQGCPDSDGDGIADDKDKCPTIKGLAAFQGCPDTDGDGIADAEDKCPTQFGVVANFGCPEVKAPVVSEEVKKEVQQKLSFAAKNIEFETGSDIIRKTSYDDLDNVVSILNQYPSLTVAIDGHTDNVGKEQANVDLSMRRATSVFNYLSKKGIASNRLTPAGFGPYKPIASNSTTEGKQRNRRVELNIK